MEKGEKRSLDDLLYVFITCVYIWLSILYILGQYDGMSKPLPEYHVKIAGFDQRVSKDIVMCFLSYYKY